MDSISILAFLCSIPLDNAKNYGIYQKHVGGEAMFPQIRLSIARAPTSVIPPSIFHPSHPCSLFAWIPDNQSILSANVSPSFYSHTPARLFKGWIAQHSFSHTFSSCSHLSFHLCTFLHLLSFFLLPPPLFFLFCLWQMLLLCCLCSLHLIWVWIHLAAIRCLSTDPAQSSAKARNPFKQHNSWQRENDQYRWRSNGLNADNCD